MIDFPIPQIAQELRLAQGQVAATVSKLVDLSMLGVGSRAGYTHLCNHPLGLPQTEQLPL